MSKKSEEKNRKIFLWLIVGAFALFLANNYLPKAPAGQGMPSATTLPPSCSYNSQCGSVTVLPVCQGNNIVSAAYTPTCINGMCSNQVNYQNILANCPNGCSNGACIGATTTTTAVTTTTQDCGWMGILCWNLGTTTTMWILPSTTFWMPNIPTTTMPAGCPWYDPLCDFDMPDFGIPTTTTTTTTFWIFTPTSFFYTPTTLFYIPIYECVNDDDCGDPDCYIERGSGYCIDVQPTCEPLTHTCSDKYTTNFGRTYGCIQMAKGSRCL
jgi:hypothetical protein